MRRVFEDISSLDKEAGKILSEEILMENASMALANCVKKHLSKDGSVLVVAGAGNNGADAIAAARILGAKLYLPFGVKSQLAKLQLNRAVHVEVVSQIYDADIIVDGLFGAGLNKELDENTTNIIRELNRLNGYKIACDIPTGLGQNGEVFRANTTVTMGALKSVLFCEDAKDFVGELEVASLGLPRDIYEKNSNTYLLEREDLQLPNRVKQNRNKGDFGHLLVVGGEKFGAGILSAMSAFEFGCGLVSYFNEKIKNPNLPLQIMQTNSLLNNTNAICVGMGLGNLSENVSEFLLTANAKMVIDADLLHNEIVAKLSQKEGVIFTPHPKEFSSLLELCGFGKFDVKTIQNNRIKLARQFTQKTNATLVLKGVFTLISKKGEVFINPFGSSALAKGGSGDVLAGMIASLLAQGYEDTKACKSAVLRHAIIGEEFDYNLTPQKLIERI